MADRGVAMAEIFPKSNAPHLGEVSISWADPDPIKYMTLTDRYTTRDIS